MQSIVEGCDECGGQTTEQPGDCVYYMLECIVMPCVHKLSWHNSMPNAAPGCRRWLSTIGNSPPSPPLEELHLRACCYLNNLAGCPGSPTIFIKYLYFFTSTLIALNNIYSLFWKYNALMNNLLDFIEEAIYDFPFWAKSECVYFSQNVSNQTCQTR